MFYHLRYIMHVYLIFVLLILIQQSSADVGAVTLDYWIVTL